MKNVVDEILADVGEQYINIHGCLDTGLGETGRRKGMEKAVRRVLTKHLLAREFVKVLREWLNETEYQTVLRLNERDIADKGICHSHDYCDANMAMYKAFQRVLGREMALDGTAQADADLETTNEAWNYAREHLLRSKP